MGKQANLKINHHRKRGNVIPAEAFVHQYMMEQRREKRKAWAVELEKDREEMIKFIEDMVIDNEMTGREAEKEIEHELKKGLVSIHHNGNRHQRRVDLTVCRLARKYQLRELKTASVKKRTFKVRA